MAMYKFFSMTALFAITGIASLAPPPSASAIAPSAFGRKDKDSDTVAIAVEVPVESVPLPEFSSSIPLSDAQLRSNAQQAWDRKDYSQVVIPLDKILEFNNDDYWKKGHAYMFLALAGAAGSIQTKDYYSQAETALTWINTKAFGPIEKIPSEKMALWRSLNAVQYQLALFAFNDGKFKEAEQYAINSITQINQISNPKKTNKDWQDVFASRSLLIRIYGESGKMPEMLKTTLEAIDTFESIPVSARDSSLRRTVAGYYSGAGQFYTEHNMTEAARRAHQGAIDAINAIPRAERISSDRAILQAAQTALNTPAPLVTPRRPHI
jgi:hypothetical protein